MKTISLELNPKLVYAQVEPTLHKMKNDCLLFFKGFEDDEELDQAKQVVVAVSKKMYLKAFDEYIKRKLHYSECSGPEAGVGLYKAYCEDYWLDTNGKQLTMSILNEELNEEECEFIEVECYFARDFTCEIEHG